MVAQADSIKALAAEKVELLRESESLQNALADGGELTDDQASRIDLVINRLEEIDIEISDAESEFKNNERREKLNKLSKLAGQPKPRRSGSGSGGMQSRNAWGRNSLGAQLSAAAQYRITGQIDPRFKDATGANTQVPSEGGFLIGADEETDLMSKIYGDHGSFLSRVSRTPLSGNSDTLKLRMLKETDRGDGTRGGGVLAYWEGEGDSTTATQRKYRLLELSLKKLMAVTYATNELLQDHSALQAENEVAYREEMTFQIERSIFKGDGVAKPLGVMNSPSLVTIDAETGQTILDPLVYENIVKMEGRLHPRSQAAAVYVANLALKPHIMLMTMTIGTSGVPVYLPPTGASGAPYGTLLGRPILFTEHNMAVGTAGDIVLADFSQYRLIDKGGVDGQSSTHVAFLTDETAFRWTYRVNGKPKWEAAMTPDDDGNTLSPFVALATRS